jgi:hypothetical protein
VLAPISLSLLSVRECVKPFMTLISLRSRESLPVGMSCATSTRVGDGEELMCMPLIRGKLHKLDSDSTRAVRSDTMVGSANLSIPSTGSVGTLAVATSCAIASLAQRLLLGLHVASRDGSEVVTPTDCPLQDAHSGDSVAARINSSSCSFFFRIAKSFRDRVISTFGAGGGDNGGEGTRGDD